MKIESNTTGVAPRWAQHANFQVMAEKTVFVVYNIQIKMWIILTKRCVCSLALVHGLHEYIEQHSLQQYLLSNQYLSW